MTDYLTEQEQIQQLKNWIKQYGFTILLGIVIALILTSGWRYWTERQNKTLFHASQVYDEMITVRAQNNEARTVIQSKKLLERYPQTGYGEMGALMLAREAVLKKEYKEAEKQLEWVIAQSKNASMREIARLRLARILIMRKKPDEAITILSKVDDNNFMGLVDEIRGDAYLAKNDLPAARQSYQLALQELPNSEVSRPILQMKFNNLTTETNPS